MQKENSKLKGIIEELTVELKKNRGSIRPMITRKQSQAAALRNKALLRKIQGIKSEHPAWGYRRVWAYLRYREGLLVNQNNRAKRTPNSL